MRFDEVFTGPRVRQIETAALAGEAYAEAGLALARAACGCRSSMSTRSIG